MCRVLWLCLILAVVAHARSWDRLHQDSNYSRGFLPLRDDHQKKLAMADFAGWTKLTDGSLIGAYDSKWVRYFNPFTGTNHWWLGIKGALTTPPRVVATSVFLTTGDGEVLKVNLDSGSVMWTQRDLDSFVARTLTVTEDLLFAITAKQTMYAMEAATGKVLWSYAGVQPAELFVRSSSGAVVHADTVLFGDAGGNLHFLDKSSGKLKRKLEVSQFAQRDERFFSFVGEFSYRDGKFFVVRYDGVILEIDPLSATAKLWKTDIVLPTVSSVLWGDDFVMLGTVNGMLYKLSLVTGLKLWSYEAGRSITSLSVKPSGCFAITLDGMLNLLDPESGRLRYLRFLGNGVYSEPFMHADLVYFPTYQGAYVFVGS